MTNLESSQSHPALIGPTHISNDAAHGGQLASLDHRLSVSAVRAGRAALRLI
jgi:hypothetical protein